MAKNVLPKHWNGSEFEELHIVTKASNVFTNDNKSVQQKIDDFTSHLAENVAGDLLLLIQQNESDIKSLNKIKTNVTVLANEWTLNESTNRYEYVITDSDITADSVVDVNIQVEYLDDAKMLLSACTSTDGAVTLYSLSALDNDLVVDYRITRQVT